MTYYGGTQLADAFRIVRKNTIQIAHDIPEDKYDFQPAPASRSVRETLVHLALAPMWAIHVHMNSISDMTKVNFPELMQTVTAEQARPRRKAEIVALLETEGEKFASAMDGFSESLLAEMVTMMPGAEPPAKSRFEMLLGVKEHEMHHRAQLMLMQRMIGQVPHLTRAMQERFAAAAAQRT
jgi:uncharacterized damage-inducible protein DinB